MSKKQNNWILLLIIVLALLVRLAGIEHGFPFIFHPDEPTIVRSALGIRFELNPKHFDWPSLYIYLNYFLYMVFAKFRGFVPSLGLSNFFIKVFPLMWDDKLVFYYLTRCFSAILGALTAIPIYMSGKKLFGRSAGVFAALAFALMPYHVRHSHYSLPDVPMVFFLSWGLYFATCILREESIRNYLFSGLFVGFAASTKYNGGLSAIAIPIAHFLRIFERKKQDRAVRLVTMKGLGALVISGLAAIAGFIIGTPYALLDYKTFSRTDGPTGAFWQFTNVGSVSLSEHLVKFSSDLTGKLAVDTGYTIMIGFIVLLTWLMFRLLQKKLEQREFYLLFLYVMALFLVWYVSGFEKNRSHYYFIAYPFLALLFGYFVDYFSFMAAKIGKLVKIAFVVLVFLPPFLLSVLQSYSFVQGDTRNELQAWLIKNNKPGTPVIYNDSTLEDVFGSLGLYSVKGESLSKNYPNSLLILADAQNDQKFLDANRANLQKIVYFSDILHKGPSISVYTQVSK
jgi:hypothetical protein